VTSEDRLRQLAEAEEPRAALLRTPVGGALGGGPIGPGEEGVTELLLIRDAQMPASSDPGEAPPPRRPTPAGRRHDGRILQPLVRSITLAVGANDSA